MDVSAIQYIFSYNLQLKTYNFCYYFFNVNLREERR